MPAVSEPSGPLLPRTWRPLGVRLAVVFFGGLLAVVCVAGWVAVGADVRAKVTVYQQATVVLFVLMALAIAWGLYRCRVTATSSGLEVVNGYRTHHYEWPEVLAVHMPPGAPEVQAYGKIVTAWFLIGWGVGGMIFGALGDRYGRAKMLTLTILIYSGFTGLTSTLSIRFPSMSTTSNRYWFQMK